MLHISWPQLTISGTPVLTVQVLHAYAGFTASASGGTGSYTFSIASGALPSGMTISATGQVSGTPSLVALVSNIVIQVTDSRGNTASLPPFSINVTLT